MPNARTAARRLVVRGRAHAADALLRGGVRIKKALLAADGTADLDPPLHDITPASVAAYFGDQPTTIYQLKQWLPVFEQVAQRHPFLIVTRDAVTTRTLRGLTQIPVAYARRIDDLLAVYRQADVKLVVYVNNGMLNFQSLIYQRALHAHVNHGESDKVSMVSNQAKSYDKVVVAGQAAIERHRRALINFPEDRLAVCGRPQLDLEVEPALGKDPADRRTVLYAPTWSGENDANNYTSLDVYGVSIVRAVLAQGDVRLAYRPHPRVINGTDPVCGAAHREILRLVRAANQAGGKHLTPFDADPLGVFEGVDLLITDISSIGLDFLYLHPETPIMLTDRRTDRTRLVTEAPIAGAVDVVDSSTVSDVGDMVRSNLTEDPRHTARAQIRSHYFGFERGGSSARFLDFVDECVADRDRLVAAPGGAAAGND